LTVILSQQQTLSNPSLWEWGNREHYRWSFTVTQ